MQRKIILTDDGSTTIHLPEWNECYHSTKGAIQEAKHVFIKNGLSTINKNEIAILEIGFGTGLNAFITYLEAKAKELSIKYIGVEAFPVSEAEIQQMNYVNELQAQEFQSVFEKMHEVPWEEENSIDANFTLFKNQIDFREVNFLNKFDIIYFDAFGYQFQPELWTQDVFQKMYDALYPEGLLVTYAARGVLKRNMQNVGFQVLKKSGPPGKREMMVGVKKN